MLLVPFTIAPNGCRLVYELSDFLYCLFHDMLTIIFASFLLNVTKFANVFSNIYTTIFYLIKFIPGSTSWK